MSIIKKTFAIFMAILLISCTVLCTLADETSITHEEAKQLYEDFMQNYVSVFLNRSMGKFEREGDDALVYCGWGELEFYPYLPNPNELRTIQDVTAYAEKIALPEVAKKMGFPSYNPDNYFIHGGKIYSRGPGGAPGDFGFTPSSEVRTEMISGTKAKIHFTIYDYAKKYFDESENPVFLEVTKTEDGLKISGGSAVELLFTRFNGGYSYSLPDENTSGIIAAAKSRFPELSIDGIKVISGDNGVFNVRVTTSDGKVFDGVVNFADVFFAKRDDTTAMLVYNVSDATGMKFYRINQTLDMALVNGEWTVVSCGSVATSDAGVYFTLIAALSVIGMAITASKKIKYC